GVRAGVRGGTVGRRLPLVRVHGDPVLCLRPPGPGLDRLRVRLSRPGRTKALQQTGPALRFFEVPAHPAGPAAERDVRRRGTLLSSGDELCSGSKHFWSWRWSSVPAGWSRKTRRDLGRWLTRPPIWRTTAARTGGCPMRSL